jgi:hypothetical protein
MYKLPSRLLAGSVTLMTACLMGFMLGSPASAHGGGLDWQGGHNCRVGSCAGTYHCHQFRGGRCPPANSGGSPSSTRLICIKQQGYAETCFRSTGWDYESCWDWGSARGQVDLQRKSSGRWRQVQGNLARKDLRRCDAEFPWLVKFSVKEALRGTSQYRLTFPDGDTRTFKVKVS